MFKIPKISINNLHYDKDQNDLLKIDQYHIFPFILIGHYLKILKILILNYFKNFYI